MSSLPMSDHRRILTLDILRGYFLLVIFADHLFRFPSLFSLFTGQSHLWVSAAEGFFMISGILIGHIPSSPTRLFRRSLSLYLISISLTLFFTFWGQFLPTTLIKSGIWSGGNISDLIFRTLTLRYVYGWTDFLAFYSVFIFFSPLALLIAKKFNGWTVIILSFIVWLLLRNTSSFFAWQFLFFSGLMVGQNLLFLESKLKKYLVPLSLITLLTIGLSALFVFVLKTNLAAYWFDKNTVGPGRFVLAWIWFTTIYLFVRSHENTIDRSTLGVFRTLGQRSLYVYCLQAFVLFPVNVWIPYQFGFFGNSFFTAVSCSLIYLFTMLYNLFYSNLKRK